LNGTFEILFRRLFQNLLVVELPEHLGAILSARLSQDRCSSWVNILLQKIEGRNEEVSVTTSS